MIDDLPFHYDIPPEPDDRAPRPHRRHVWVINPATDETRCASCDAVRDPVRARRGKSSRRLGHDQERRAERVYGWRKVGEFGSITDLQGTLMKVQQKATRSPVPTRWQGIFSALDTVNDGRTPALLLSFVAQGKPVEDFVVIRGRDWIALHGRDEAA